MVYPVPDQKTKRIVQILVEELIPLFGVPELKGSKMKQMVPRTRDVRPQPATEVKARDQRGE